MPAPLLERRAVFFRDPLRFDRVSERLITILLLSAGGVSLLLGLIAVPLMMRIARRIGYVDHPGGHKSHADPTPYGGGVAMFAAAWLPLLLLLVIQPLVPEAWVAETFGEQARALLGGLALRWYQAAAIVGGGLLLFALGLLDDFRPLGPWVKLVVILAVGALVATVGEVRLATLLGPVPSLLVTVLWIAVVANAFNFLDNMDGLSAGVAAICTFFLILCGVLAGQILVPALASVFLGSVLAFLVFNFPPARIFMGDAGSLVLGYMLAVTSVLTSYWESGTDRQPFALAMPLVILAVPLYDMISVVIIRLSEGRSPIRGDQRHFSHRLVQRGLSRRQAVLTIYLVTGTTALAATLLPEADLRTSATVLSIVVLVLLVIAILEAPDQRAGEASPPRRREQQGSGES